MDTVQQVAIEEKIISSEGEGKEKVLLVNFKSVTKINSFEIDGVGFEDKYICFTVKLDAINKKRLISSISRIV